MRRLSFDGGRRRVARATEGRRAGQTLVWAGLTGLLLLALSAACDQRRGGGLEGVEGRAQAAEQAAGEESGVTEGPNYTIFHPGASVAVEAAGRLDLRVTAKGGFKVNTEYPWLLTLAPVESIAIERLEWDAQAAERLTEEEAVFVVPVSAGAPGRYEVAGHLRFSVCNDYRCDTPQARFSWVVTVE